jgi:hypothetical protein
VRVVSGEEHLDSKTSFIMHISPHHFGPSRGWGSFSKVEKGAGGFKESEVGEMVIGGWERSPTPQHRSHQNFIKP